MKFLIRQIENWQDAKPEAILDYFQESITTKPTCDVACKGGCGCSCCSSAYGDSLGSE